MSTTKKPHTTPSARPLAGLFGSRRVFIDREGHLLELPLGHSLQIGEPDEAGRQVVSLAARFSGWAEYELESVEESENDRVTITLGTQIAHGGAQVQPAGDDVLQGLTVF